jgi:hypothetical protein
MKTEVGFGTLSLFYVPFLPAGVDLEARIIKRNQNQEVSSSNFPIDSSSSYVTTFDWVNTRIALKIA